MKEDVRLYLLFDSIEIKVTHNTNHSASIKHVRNGKLIPERFPDRLLRSPSQFLNSSFIQDIILALSIRIEGGKASSRKELQAKKVQEIIFNG